MKILHGLIDEGVVVVSYSCDGTETERAVQQLVIDKADTVIPYAIAHPSPTQAALVISIPIIHGQAVIMVQDSKHAAKTYRNNLFSGARLLAFGNYVAMYSQVRELAWEPDAPLYRRDVEKVDRQDDNAALRLFSSTHLEYVIKQRPEFVGLAVYIFVYAELVLVYQKREELTLLERTKIALRARYFLDLWRLYLRKAGYSEARYCLSREAIDITRILIDGFIALLVVHRDHLKGAFPFIPWLHSTEACEHIFGECRKLVEDFTFLDFLYMIPRLFVLVRAACQSGATSDPRARASGYAHTYFDCGKVNLALLALYPTDDEIALVAKEAWEEATNLWDLLGVAPSDLLTPEATLPTKFPSVASWFPPGDDPVYDYDKEDLDGCDFNDYDSGDEILAADVLQDILDREREAPSRSAVTERRMEALTSASIALAMDDMCRAYVSSCPSLIVVHANIFAHHSQTLEELTEAERQAMTKEDSQLVQDALAASRVPQVPMLTSVAAEPTRPMDSHMAAALLNVDLTQLVSILRSHETPRARLAVRTNKHAANDPANKTQKESARQALIREINQTLRLEQERGIGTGLARDARWRTHIAEGVKATNDATTQASGNTANAALAAGARATTVCDSS